MLLVLLLIIEGLYSAKLKQSSDALESKKGLSRDRYGRHPNSTSRGYDNGGGTSQSEQVSLELASETSNCLLWSDNLWEPVPFRWGSSCKCTPTYVFLWSD